MMLRYAVVVIALWLLCSCAVVDARPGAYEYTLLTRLPDGRVITDPSSPEEYTPLCYSFDGLGNGVRSLVRWDGASWRIRIDERYSFALVCIDRQWAIIEDADRAPGAVLILDTASMQSLCVHEDTESQPIDVHATACYVDRYHGVFCYEAEVSLEADSDGARWWVNVNDGWDLTVTTSQPAASTEAIIL